MNPRAAGFTLIELLATTALAGLLTVSLLQVTQATGRTRTVMSESPWLDGAWRDRLTAVLRADLERALRVTREDDRLRIEGPCGWDRGSREPSHEPAVVVYRRIGGVAAGTEDSTFGGVLVREQRDLLDLGQQRPQRELVAAGVADWSVDTTVSGRRPGSPPDRISIRFVDGTQLKLALPTRSLRPGAVAR